MKGRPSRLRRIVEILLLGLLAVTALLLAAAAYFFWPRSYARPYVGDARIEAAPALAPLAQRAQLFVGAAVHATEIDAFAAAASTEWVCRYFIKSLV